MSGGEVVEAKHDPSGSLRLARWLLLATVLWNAVEFAVAVAAGLSAGSIALVAFGLDSGIEIAASAVLVWRVARPDADPVGESRERIARLVVGATFLALAAYVVVESGYELAARRKPEPSAVGISLAVAALVAMPWLAWLKRRNAERLGSRSLIAEAKETFFCAGLAVALLVGLVANAAAGWWWADGIAALIMVPWLIHEGLEGVRGDGD